MHGLTKEHLDYLYNEELLTDSEIAERYDTYQVKISRMRKKWGIETLDKTGRMKASLPNITKKQHQLLIGSLMGDGWMEKGSEETARFCETHSEKQENYLRWKKNELGSYVSSFYSTTKEDGDSTYHGYGMSTVTCPQLRYYYDLFYPEPDRVRSFSVFLKNHFTPLVLTIWYLDDGTLKNKYHPVITFGLDDDSLFNCVEALRELNLSPSIRDNSDGTSTISFPSQSRLFWDLVEDHVPNCMSYKLPEESERREQDRKARQLDSETACELSKGGMPYEEIGRLYDVSKSTVCRRIKEGDLEDMGRPRSSYSQKASKIVLEEYDSNEWSDLSDSKQQEWVDDIYSILKKTDFPYPDKYQGEKLKEAFNQLKNKNIYLNEEKEIRPRTFYGLKLCDGYFPNRFEARYKDLESCYEGWFDEEILRKAIKIQLKGGDPVIPYRVRKAVQYQLRTPTIFRPGVSKYLYERYVPDDGVTWDPCSGYGGRMVSALCTDTRYIGTDVDEKTIRGNQKLAEALGLGDKVELFCEPAETFKLPSKVDFVFTSPPYFDREKYSDNQNQSWVQYKNANSWLNEFLSPLVSESYGSLKDNGCLALNICDIKERNETIPLEDKTKEIAQERGFELVDTLKMPLSNLSPRSYEPIFVFTKK